MVMMAFSDNTDGSRRIQNFDTTEEQTPPVSQRKPKPMCEDCPIADFSPDLFEQAQIQGAVAYIVKCGKAKREEFMEEEHGVQQFSQEYHSGMFNVTDAQVVIDCFRNRMCNPYHVGFELDK